MSHMISPLSSVIASIKMSFKFVALNGYSHSDEKVDYWGS